MLDEQGKKGKVNEGVNFELYLNGMCELYFAFGKIGF
jgi:hypothetical protein